MCSINCTYKQLKSRISKLQIQTVFSNYFKINCAHKTAEISKYSNSNTRTSLKWLITLVRIILPIIKFQSTWKWRNTFKHKKKKMKKSLSKAGISSPPYFLLRPFKDFTFWLLKIPHIYFAIFLNSYFYLWVFYFSNFLYRVYFVNKEIIWSSFSVCIIISFLHAARTTFSNL